MERWPNAPDATVSCDISITPLKIELPENNIVLRQTFYPQTTQFKGDYIMASVYDDSVSARGGLAAPSVAVIPSGAGGGFAEGGLLGTLLLLGLLGGNGGLGNNRKDCVDQAALNALQGSFDTNSILGKLGSIEAAIPYNEAQVQLALAGAVSQLTGQATANTNTVLAGQTAAALAAVTNQALLTRDIAGVETTVDRAAATVINTIRDDGNATRALITSNVIQDLRDDKVILSNELAELRNERNRDRDRNGIEINMLQNQQQAQLQFQEQRQRMDGINNFLCGIGAQIARATNSNVIVGNTGATTTGTQTANPTNVAV